MQRQKRVSSVSPVVVIRKKKVKPVHQSVQAQPGRKLLPPAAALPATTPAAVPSVNPHALSLPESQELQPVPVPSITSPTVRSKREQEKQARRELLAVFRERWPQVFPQDFRAVRPLAVGIHRDIGVHLPKQPLSRISNTIAMFQRLSGAGYFRAVLRGGPRYDLEGNPCGEVTKEEQALAKRDLTAYYERRKAGRQAAEVAQVQQTLTLETLPI